MMPGSQAPVIITEKTVRQLALVQSILSGLQVIAAASILGDVIGAKYAALFMVLVSGVQTTVNTYISKTVAVAVSHAGTVVARAELVTEHASEQVSALAAAMPPQTASRALLQQSQERKPNG